MKCISGHINLILKIYLKLFESVVKFVTKVAEIESEEVFLYNCAYDMYANDIL